MPRHARSDWNGKMLILGPLVMAVLGERSKGKVCSSPRLKICLSGRGLDQWGRQDLVIGATPHDDVKMPPQLSPSLIKINYFKRPQL